MYKCYSFIGLFRKGDKQGDEVSGLCLFNENKLFTGWRMGITKKFNMLDGCNFKSYSIYISYNITFRSIGIICLN